MPWEIKSIRQAFYKGEGKRCDEEYYGRQLYIKHTDGRETCPLLFTYDGAKVWRDLVAVRKALLEGRSELDLGWQKHDSSDRDLIAEAYDLTKKLNSLDIKSAKLQKPPKYPIEIFSPGKKLPWFAKADGFMTFTEYDEDTRRKAELAKPNTKYPYETDYKSKGFAVCEQMDDCDWKIQNEQLRDDWANRKPLDAESLADAAIVEKERLRHQAEESLRRSLSTLNHHLFIAHADIKRNIELNGATPKLSKANKLATELDKLISSMRK
jgi:hypothetical protein